MLVSEVLSQYLLVHPHGPQSTKRNFLKIALFERWLGRPAMITDLAERVNEFLAAYEQTVAPHTVRDALVVYRFLLRFGEETGLCQFPRLRKIKIRDKPPTAPQIRSLQRLLRYATEIQKAAIMLVYDTGLRRGDLFRATWDDLHKIRLKRFKRDEGAVYYWRLIMVQSKTGKTIERRVRAKTVRVLQNVRKSYDNRLVPWPYQDRWWNICWKRLIAKAGTPECTGLQSIRRSGASYCARAGMSASDYLGHASPMIAKQFYIDPRIASRPGPMPPQILEHREVWDDEEPYEIASQRGLGRGRND